MILVIPVFVPHAGCPHNCCFCNQKIISGSEKLPGADEIAEKIGSYRNEASRYDRVEVAFFGGSFTAVEPMVQEHYLKAAAPFLKERGGFVDCIRISTRPDAIDGEVIERLKKYSVRIVELGAQSMDEKVLELSERGHTPEDTRKAAKMLKEAGFTLGLQTMTGLPGADRESDIRTAFEIADLEPDLVRIYPTVVVRNTKLCRDFEAGRYKPMSTEDAVQLCSDLCGIYLKRGIAVARIGLQSTDSITRGGQESEIAGGPYHEAFGQLVRSYDARKAVEEALKEVRVKYPEAIFGTLTVLTDPVYFSDVLGQKRENGKYLADLFGFRNVSVADKNKPEDEIFRKRAGKVRQAETVVKEREDSLSRLATVVKTTVYERREPTGKDSFRVFTDVAVTVDLVSLR